MNYVEPIRQSNIVHDIESYLKKKNERDYIMFLCGIYTGLRISDILRLKIGDVKNRKYIYLREKKTGKQKNIKINPFLKREFANYVYDKDPDDYLIKSRQGYNKPITRSMAYKILQDVADRFGLDCVGCHTLRKTFGYHYYKQTKDLAKLMMIFNHADQSYTLRYIGINQESMDDAMDRFKI